MKPVKLRRQRILPLISAVLFAAAMAFMVTDRDWAYPMALAIYLLVLAVALERSGL